MKRLIVTAAVSGRVLDTVTLTDAGDVEYDTGAAESMLAGRLGDGGTAAAAAFAQLDGWSNGQVSVTGDPPATRTPASVATAESGRPVDDAADVVLAEGWVPPVLVRDITEARSDRKLRKYWVSGAGAAKIGWNTGGDFTRCVAELGEHVSDPEGLCAEYHKAATGEWPGKKGAS